MFILVGDVSALIEFASFLIWVFYGSAFVCLLVLRRTQPDTPRPYKVPIVIPILSLGVAIFLSVTPLITEPPLKYLAALGFIGSGILVYTPFVYYKQRPKFMGKEHTNFLSRVSQQNSKQTFLCVADKFTFLVQVLFEAVPGDKKDV